MSPAGSFGVGSTEPLLVSALKQRNAGGRNTVAVVPLALGLLHGIQDPAVSGPQPGVSGAKFLSPVKGGVPVYVYVPVTVAPPSAEFPPAGLFPMPPVPLGLLPLPPAPPAEDVELPQIP